MIELPKYTISTYDPHALAPNQHTDFTRRIPTGLSDRQMQRDAKIARQIITAYEQGGDRAAERIIDIFTAKARLLSHPRYWELMRTVWVAAGSTETANRFRVLMRSGRPCRSWFMTPEDAEALSKMPLPLNVWRAYDPKYDTPEYQQYGGDPGISWTLSEEWCREYAAKKGRVVKHRQV